MPPAVSELAETLAALCGEPGLSGREEPVRRRVAGLLAGRVDSLRTDALGNLIAVKGAGKPGPRLMLSAHMDEVGFLVSGIDAEGYLRFVKVGGLDDRILPGKQVRVGAQGIPGVILARPPHLQKREEKERVVPATDLRIDIGARSREQAERHVAVGDSVLFDAGFAELGAGRVAGRAFDDRAGCAVLVHTLLETYPCEVVGVFTVQEEVGLRGAGPAAYAVDPQLALVLEVTGASDVPGASPEAEATALGAGPAITFIDRATLPPAALVELLVDTAQRAGIPWQWRKTVAGGTEAGRILQTRAGIPAGTVSVPCRYIHSPWAVLDLADLANTLTLTRAFVERVGREAGLLEERGLLQRQG